MRRRNAARGTIWALSRIDNTFRGNAVVSRSQLERESDNGCKIIPSQVLGHGSQQEQFGGIGARSKIPQP